MDYKVLRPKKLDKEYAAESVKEGAQPQAENQSFRAIPYTPVNELVMTLCHTGSADQTIA